MVLRSVNLLTSEEFAREVSSPPVFLYLSYPSLNYLSISLITSFSYVDLVRPSSLLISLPTLTT